MIYKNYNFLTSLSISTWRRKPTPSSTICIRSLRKVGQPGLTNASPRYRKNVDIPRNPVTATPKKYKILKAAGNVTIKNTNKWDMMRGMLELFSSYECPGYDLLFANGVHHNGIDAESYKLSHTYFPVKEPLEFTLGFTERKNEMEVL